VSQLESTMNLLGPAIVGYSLTHENPGPVGNESDTDTPYGVFHCGNDVWIAIAVRTDEEWAGLARSAAGQPWATAAGHATREGRLANRAALKAGIAAWVDGQDAFVLMQTLQEAGVPAGVVQ